MKRDLRQRLSDGLRLFYYDVKSAKWAVMLLIAYFAFLKIFLHSLCPVVLVTGFPCPGCGMTRAGFRILHLDFYGAFRMHPFIYGVIALAVIFAVERYVLQTKKMTVTVWFASFMIVGMVALYVYRMIQYFPYVPPMTYYRHNLLAGLRFIGKQAY